MQPPTLPARSGRFLHAKNWFMPEASPCPRNVDLVVPSRSLGDWNSLSEIQRPISIYRAVGWNASILVLLRERFDAHLTFRRVLSERCSTSNLEKSPANQSFTGPPPCDRMDSYSLKRLHTRHGFHLGFHYMDLKMDLDMDSSMLNYCKLSLKLSVPPMLTRLTVAGGFRGTYKRRP